MRFFDLTEKIQEDNRVDEWPQTQVVEDTLQWLDCHPELAGKTITADRYRQVQKMDGGYIRGYDDALIDTGTVVLAEPEPTNADKWVKFCREELGLDLLPWQAEYLVRTGAKAPGGDDE